MNSKNGKYYITCLLCKIFFKRKEKSTGCCQDQVSHVKLSFYEYLVSSVIYTNILKLESMRSPLCFVISEFTRKRIKVDIKVTYKNVI